MVGRGRGRGSNIRDSLWVDWDSFVGNISNISVVVVSSVLDMLSTAIRKSNIVRSRDNTGSICSLSSVKVSLGVVVSNSVGVGVWFIDICGLNISSWGMISWGSMDYWDMISRGSMDNRGNMDGMSNWVMDSMSNWVVNSMGNRVGDTQLLSNWVVHSV